MMLKTLAMLAQSVPGATPYDVRVPNAIVGLHNQYVRCQDQNFDMGHVRSIRYVSGRGGACHRGLRVAEGHAHAAGRKGAGRRPNMPMPTVRRARNQRSF